MVDVIEAGRYYIMARTNLATPILYEGRKLDDAIYFGEQQCYRYDVHSDTDDVHFKFSLFSGLVSYQIEPLLPPNTTGIMTRFV
jgi:hypothetical protein